jgi:hypothetical protein
LRQKIDEGLAGCTHFLVLLTPTSITKPWVNQEMDAALVRKLNEETRFIAVRSGMQANALPPLLKGMLSPPIDDFDADVAQFVNDIRLQLCLWRGYSAAATTVAKVFVESSKTALFGDPQLTVADLVKRTSPSEDDVRDALHELRAVFTASHDRALPKDELFVIFDEHFMPWDPTADALTLAADLVNDASFPGNTPDIAVRYDWLPRRLNPAIAFLINRALIMDSKAIGAAPWITLSVRRG